VVGALVSEAAAQVLRAVVAASRLAGAEVAEVVAEAVDLARILALHRVETRWRTVKMRDFA
jgi:hypothetical protein